MISPYTLDMLEAASFVRQCLDEESLGRVTTFLQGQLTPEGGFGNRAGQADLYYTVFGIDCLRALNESLPVEALRSFVDGFGTGEGLDFVHLVCLIRCRGALFGGEAGDPAARVILERLKPYATADGGFNSKMGARHGSTYASFLACLAHESVGLPLSSVNGMVRSLARLKAQDGGFANAPGMPRGTVPATAAACVTLIRLGESVEPSVVEWLLSRCESDGGFRATPEAPWPDLLSTATALYALKLAAVDLAPLREPCLDFVESLWDESGGFVGHQADSVPDCEHTFYGLLAMGCLESP
ncbi:MAG: hypothetical protein N2255_05240 [Kiritimatiellae bacterium]|nr:hypothetical protein [Kiritimatiellia bacterium]